MKGIFSFIFLLWYLAKKCFSLISIGSKTLKIFELVFFKWDEILDLFFFFTWTLWSVNLLSSGTTALLRRPELSQVCGVELSWWGNDLISLGALAMLCWDVPVCPYQAPARGFFSKDAPGCDGMTVTQLQALVAGPQHHHGLNVLFQPLTFSWDCAWFGSVFRIRISLFDLSTQPFLHEV